MFITFITSECTKNTQRKFTDTYVFIKNSWKKRKLNIKYKSCHVFFHKKGNKYNLLFNLTYFLVKY